MTEDTVYYYFKASERVQLSEHFSTWEFRCKSYDKWNDDCDCKVSKELVRRLEILREEFSKFAGKSVPILITSGFRTESYNMHLIELELPASPTSQHLFGNAVDIICYGISPKQMKKIAEKIFFDGGVGIYSWGIHVDVRGHKARWDYRKVK